jgi:ABC-type polysaccharide/polyol phosphate export permease
VGLIVFSSLSPMHFGISGYIMVVIYVLVLNILNANVLVFLSLLTERVTIFIMLILSLIVLLIFGSGLVVELEFYPTTIGLIFQWFPTSQLIRGLRLFLFTNMIDWISLVYPLAMAILLLFVNAEFLKRKLRQ